MAIPQNRTQVTPTRAVKNFVLGKGPFMPPVTTTQTLPNQTTPANTPPPLILTGTDLQAATVAVPALTAGASATLVVSVPFPNIPLNPNQFQAGQQPVAVAVRTLTTRQSDTVLFNAIAQATASVPGLSITSVSSMPTAKTTSQSFTGPNLPGGQSYTAFLAVVTVQVAATAATPAGTLTVTANANLVVQQG